MYKEVDTYVRLHFCTYLIQTHRTYVSWACDYAYILRAVTVSFEHLNGVCVEHVREPLSDNFVIVEWSVIQ